MQFANDFRVRLGTSQPGLYNHRFSDLILCDICHAAFLSPAFPPQLISILENGDHPRLSDLAYIAQVDLHRISLRLSANAFIRVTGRHQPGAWLQSLNPSSLSDISRDGTGPTTIIRSTLTALYSTSSPAQHITCHT